jgi:hypothetical protein
MHEKINIYKQNRIQHLVNMKPERLTIQMVKNISRGRRDISRPGIRWS